MVSYGVQQGYPTFSGWWFNRDPKLGSQKKAPQEKAFWVRAKWLLNADVVINGKTISKTETEGANNSKIEETRSDVDLYLNQDTYHATLVNKDRYSAYANERERNLTIKNSVYPQITIQYCDFYRNQTTRAHYGGNITRNSESLTYSERLAPDKQVMSFDFCEGTKFKERTQFKNWFQQLITKINDYPTSGRGVRESIS